MTAPTFAEDTDNPLGSLAGFVMHQRRLVMGVVVAIVVAGGGYWWYVRSAQIKSANASKALMSAKVSLQSGNLALAQSDLQKVVERFKGTTPGSEAALMLAQLDFDQQKYAEGIAILERAMDGAPEPLAASMKVMIADGQMDLKKPAEAAQTYLDAAGMTPYDGEKSALQTRAARAYTVAGQPEKAREIWQKLAESSKNPSAAAEARVRLGELTAKPAG